MLMPYSKTGTRPSAPQRNRSNGSPVRAKTSSPLTSVVTFGVLHPSSTACAAAFSVAGSVILVSG